MSTPTDLRPDSPELAEAARSWRSAYVHLPFCARLCPYCDFAVVTGRDGEIERYVSALIAEIRREPPFGPLDAVYLGGGTPSRVEPKLLGKVLAALDDIHGIRPDAEASIEANPEDWSAAIGEAWRNSGLNRVSFGAQSLDPATLRYLGRRHEAVEVGRAVAGARAVGFRSVNLDLIFGSPGDSAWEDTLRGALGLGPDHLSCYALTVEPGTELFRAIKAGAPAPDDDAQAEQWELADRRATAAGLVRYEVSNWARPGHAVRYNLAVWAQAEYLGFGLGAHRFRDGVRSHNFRHLDTYLESVEAGRPPRAGAEAVTGWPAEVERAFLGVRRAAGVVAGEAGRRLLSAPEGRQLVELRILELKHGRLVVPRPLLTDAVSRALLRLPPTTDC